MAKIGWGSCAHQNRVSYTGYHASQENLDCFIMEGDMPYCETDTLAFGVQANAASGTGAVSAPESWQAPNLVLSHQQTRNNPGNKSLIESTRFYYMWDDHEFPGDNWDHSVLNASKHAAIATDQDDVDAIFAQARGAFVQFNLGNLENNDSEAVAQAPPDANAADSEYAPLYFRATHGDSEVFVLDMMSHRDGVRTTASASKTMLGTVQKAWLKKYLLSSTDKWKFICSSKKTYPGNNADNTDAWFAGGINTGYEHERDEILQYIEDNAITNVIWLSGDRHQITVDSMELTDAEPFNHVDVCACPFGVDVVSALTTAGTYTKFINDGTYKQRTSGTTDSASAANKVEDSTNDFLAAGVRVGDTVYNTTDDTSSYITAVNSATQLTIYAGIMANAEDYHIALPGQCYGVAETTDDFCFLYLKDIEGNVMWSGVVADGTNYLGENDEVPIAI